MQFVVASSLQDKEHDLRHKNDPRRLAKDTLRGGILLNMLSRDRPLGVVAKDIVISAEGLGFDYRAGQIGHSVANGSPPLRCLFGAVLSRR